MNFKPWWAAALAPPQFSLVLTVLGDTASAAHSAAGRCAERKAPVALLL